MPPITRLSEQIELLLRASTSLNMYDHELRSRFIAAGVKDYIAYRLTRETTSDVRPLGPESPETADK